ncbi:MAG: S1 RNA-binding domain-containing protein [Oscillospiraceae bacterium]|nr:S1 RNA-binding domain-containing protein [Oscillospiraceae bacterium]
MQLEIGSVYEGRVKGITQYGAFVEISAADETGAVRTVTGMVHISEVSDTFVRDIHEHLNEQDTVRVKVLAYTPEGRLSLSIRKAAEQAEGQKRGEQAGGRPPKQRRQAKPYVYEPKKTVPQSEMSFEDKLRHFTQQSEEKRCELRRGNERRGGSRGGSARGSRKS